MAVGLSHRLAGWIGAGFLHLVAKTSFVIRVDDPACLSLRRKRQSAIYAFWHRNQVFLSYHHRGEPIDVLVSRSSDGEYIAQVLHRLKINSVRGSSSRGGMSAFRQLCEGLKNGRQAGFTPDGPRGPVQTVHDGVIEASRFSGAPIIPMAVASRRQVVFKSWDRLFIPLPFSTIVVAHGKPFVVSPDTTDEVAREKVRVALNAVTDTAEETLRNAPSWFVSFAGAFMGAMYQVLAVLFLPLILLGFCFRFGFRRMARGLHERLGAPTLSTLPDGARRFWLHAASLGEWQALRPLLMEIRRRPDVSVLVTVSTMEARMLISREEPGLTVRLLPIDLTLFARRFVRRLRPDVAIFVETEIWPALFRALHARHIPIFIVNGRMSARGVSRWRFVYSLARRVMATLSGLMARTDLDAQRYVSLGLPVNRVYITGNTKSDNLVLMPEEERRSRRRDLFGSDEGVYLIGGSTWHGEEETLLHLLDQKSEIRLRLILAPRRPERFSEVTRLLESRANSWSRWSTVKESRDWSTDILLVDTLGDLARIYATGDVAFLGGSLAGRGGQNPLEPAAAGLALMYGPSMENFAEEARDLVRANAARSARTAEDLIEDARDLIRDENLRRAMGKAAQKAVAEKLGASKRTLMHLEKMLSLGSPA